MSLHPGIEEEAESGGAHLSCLSPDLCAAHTPGASQGSAVDLS